MTIFERATRVKFRFPSTAGSLNVEQLWDLPLTKSGGIDLDKVARTVNAELKEVTEESFVSTGNNPAKAELTLKLELVKHIIGVKMQEAETAKTAKVNAERRKVLLEALANKQGARVHAMSEQDIIRELENL